MNRLPRYLTVVAAVTMLTLLPILGAQCKPNSAGGTGPESPTASVTEPGPGAGDSEFLAQYAEPAEGVLEDPVVSLADDPKKNGRKERGTLQARKMPDKNNRGGGRELAVANPQQKRNAQDPSGEGGDKPKMQISQSGRRPRSNPTVIEDIAAYRQKPLDFITRYDERFVPDLDNVDFEADVIATIDGRPLTRAEFRKNVVDSLGALDLDRFLSSVLTDIAMKKLVAEGADPESFKVPEEMIDAEINNQIMLAKQQDRTGKFEAEAWKEMIETSYGWEKFRDMQRSILAFGNVYLPLIEPKEVKQEPAPPQPDPGGDIEAKEIKEQPAPQPFLQEPKLEDTGEEAKAELDPDLPVGKNAQGEDVNIYMPLRTWNLLDRNDTDRYTRDSLNTAYKEGRPLGSFVRPQYIRTIKEAVMDKTEITYHTSGDLPENIYMRVADRDVALDEVFPLVAGTLTDEDLKLVLLEVLAYKAMDRVLDEGGWTLGNEEFEAAFEEHEKIYEGTIFPLQFIMSLHGYYLKEDYCKMYRRRLAFEKMFEEQGKMNMDDLRDLQEKGGRLFYQNGGVKVQSLFFGIFDHETMKMREGGYAWAHEKMAEAMKEIEESGDFLAVAKKYANINGFDRPAELDYTTRNDLRSHFGEKTKTIISEGYSLADDVFYNAKEGDVIGPITITHGEFGNPVFKGVYLVKVIGYRSMLDLNPFEKSLETIKTDFIDLQLQNWAGRMLAGADIEFTKRG